MICKFVYVFVSVDHMFSHYTFTSKKISICLLGLYCARRICKQRNYRSNQRTEFCVQCAIHSSKCYIVFLSVCAGLLILSHCWAAVYLLQNCKRKLHLLVKRQNIDCVYTNWFDCISYFWLFFLFAVGWVFVVGGFFRNSHFISFWDSLRCVHHIFEYTWFCFWLQFENANRKWAFTRFYIYLQLTAYAVVILVSIIWEGKPFPYISIYNICMHYEFYSFHFGLHFICAGMKHAVDQMKYTNRNGIEPFVCS